MQKRENTKVSIEEMFKTGAHYGYSKTRRHPSMSPYIFTNKNRTDIINLEKTSELLERSLDFVKELGSKGKSILFVGTKPEAREIIKKTAEELGLSYVNERWIGGTLSNFSEIKKRIIELENYQKEEKEGVLQKYTKKERLVLAKKMEKLSRYYSGLLGLKKIPDVLFVVDAKTENIAITEARKLSIPTIALVNSDCNIKGIDYPIVANDASIPSIMLFIKAISVAYQEGKLSLSEEKQNVK